MTEGQSSGVLLGTLQAKDPDEGENGTVFYSLSGRVPAGSTESCKKKEQILSKGIHSERSFMHSLLNIVLLIQIKYKGNLISCVQPSHKKLGIFNSFLLKDKHALSV